MPFLVGKKGLKRFADLKFNGLIVVLCQILNPKRIRFGTILLLFERNPQHFELIELIELIEHIQLLKPHKPLKPFEPLKHLLPHLH